MEFAHLSWVGNMSHWDKKSSFFASDPKRSFHWLGRLNKAEILEPLEDLHTPRKHYCLRYANI